jgi:hypothetical protein
VAGLARVEETPEAWPDGAPEPQRREDLYLSSLRGFVESLGGKLELTAVFPEGRVAIADLSVEPAARRSSAERDTPEAEPEV